MSSDTSPEEITDLYSCLPSRSTSIYRTSIDRDNKVGAFDSTLSYNTLDWECCIYPFQIVLVLLLCFALSLPFQISAFAGEVNTMSQSIRIYVGTYSQEIYVYRMNLETGQLTSESQIEEVENPSFLSHKKTCLIK